MVHTLVNKQLGLRGEFDGDAYFTKEGVAYMVWSCKDLTVYDENGQIFEQPTMSNDSPAYIKRYLHGFVRI